MHIINSAAYLLLVWGGGGGVGQTNSGDQMPRKECAQSIEDETAIIIGMK